MMQCCAVRRLWWLTHFVPPQRPLARMFKTGFLPILWVCIFRAQRSASYTWMEVYKWTLRVRTQFKVDNCREG